MLFVVAIVVVAVLAAVFLAATFARRDRARATGHVSRETARRDRANPTLEDEAERSATGREVERSAALARRGGGVAVPPPAPVAIREPLDADAIGVSRRQFLNRSVTAVFAFSLSSFGAAVIAFLWPTLSGGFGSKIKVGAAHDLLTERANSKEPHYNPEGRFYLNPYPVADVDRAKKIPAYSAVVEGYQAGFVALYQKCVHLGCRVPWCKSSQWFECPCHGSQYSRVGEKKAGPAPRGLDRFAVTVEGGSVVVDTKNVIPGPPIGTDTTGQQIEGPHCA